MQTSRRPSPQLSRQLVGHLSSDTKLDTWSSYVTRFCYLLASLLVMLTQVLVPGFLHSRHFERLLTPAALKPHCLAVSSAA